MSKETTSQIEEQALAWLARKDAGNMNESEQRKLAAWVASDIAHRVALLRLEAGWERSARLKAIGAGMKRGSVPPPGVLTNSPFFESRATPAARVERKRPTLKLAGMAAAVLLIAGGALHLNSKYLSDNRYTTQVGVVASIALRDGSSMTLNSGSAVRVDMSNKVRRIELEAGEAFFKVARDSSRPFVVLAGRRRVVAIGTAFSVRRDHKEIKVVVTEGKVSLEPEQAGDGAQLLPAGAVLNTRRGSVLLQRKTPREAEEALAWRTGYLTFDETSLADAVAEFNRYTTRQIVIQDAQLSALRISGKFRSSNADDFVQLLQHGFGIRVHEEDGSINLSAP